MFIFEDAKIYSIEEPLLVEINHIVSVYYVRLVVVLVEIVLIFSLIVSLIVVVNINASFEVCNLLVKLIPSYHSAWKFLF